MIIKQQKTLVSVYYIWYQVLLSSAEDTLFAMIFCYFFLDGVIQGTVYQGCLSTFSGTGRNT